METVSLRTARRAAKSVARSERGRDVLKQVRPRLVFGLSRLRAPLTYQIWLAARNGSLAWRSPSAFCLLEPPVPAVVRAARVRNWVAGHWSLTVTATQTVVLVAAAFAAALALPRNENLALLVAALFLGSLALWSLQMIALLARMTIDLVRSMGDRRHVERVLSSHWCVALLHVVDPNEVGLVLADAVRITGTATLLLDSGRVTTSASLSSVAKFPHVYRLRGVGSRTILAVGADARLTDPRSRRVSMRSGLGTLVAGFVVGVAYTAFYVADVERAACLPRCAGRPAHFAEALYWLGSHLLPYEPDGIAAMTWQARTLGVMWTLFNLLVIGLGLGLIAEEAVNRQRAAGVDLVARFNADRDAQGKVDDLTPRRPPKGSIGWLLVGAAVGAMVHARLTRRKQPAAADDTNG